VGCCHTCGAPIAPGLLVVRIGRTERGERTLGSYCSEVCAGTPAPTPGPPVEELVLERVRPIGAPPVLELEGA
jgi:hypothetical protein